MQQRSLTPWQAQASLISMKYEEYLEQYGTLTYRNVGTSMLPLIKQGRDLFTITKKGEERCKKYDVVLYRRPPEQYVLHRIIKVRPNDYVILGDNCVKKEYGITDADILGVMTGFMHKGKNYTCEAFWYKAYSRIWVAFTPLRILAKRSIWWAKRTVKKLIGKNTK